MDSALLTCQRLRDTMFSQAIGYHRFRPKGTGDCRSISTRDSTATEGTIHCTQTVVISDALEVMPRPILYFTEMSPPCRAVLLAAEAIGLELEIRDLKEGDNLQEHFTKMNPQHTVPTLDDSGDIFWDSHAINSYLVGKYAKDDSLYPKDLRKRAVIDQRLHFDSGILFPLLRGIGRPLFYDNINTMTEEKIAQLKEAYDFLDKFLEGKKWLAGESLTLADISCLPDVGALDAFLPVAPYPNITRWMKTCERELPGYATAYLPGNSQVHQLVKQKLATAH